MEDVKVGDVVRLKSGGNTMTISEVLADGNVKCIWNVGEGKRFLLNPVALKIIQSHEFEPEEFEIGSQVRLHSGGVRMTVVEKRNDGLFQCVWNHETGSGTFAYPAIVLKRVSNTITFLK
ncbi:MAG: DUF2158 domain-containing protein [Melioribacteraceae bacterium]|nr:DUF2158 domain-containing protein [Melioribacteraceae bacterium]